MSLWNIIRDFFVQYIFGGTLSNGSVFGSSLGGFDTPSRDDTILCDTGNTFFKVGEIFNNDVSSTADFIRIGDWLSTTSTIIVLIAICVALFFFVRWLFRLTAGLFTGR